MLKRFIKVAGLQTEEERRAQLRRSLIRHEAQIGGQLFGPVPKGGRREFFCLDKYTWIWYEEWIDKDGKRRTQNTRYDIRADGILKAQDGQHYQKVSPHEVSRLVDAVNAYKKRVTKEIYQAVA
jgi:hypothetical protein